MRAKDIQQVAGIIAQSPLTPSERRLAARRAARRLRRLHPQFNVRRFLRYCLFDRSE